jgi:DNA-binding NarL/FixJ family response regulator
MASGLAKPQPGRQLTSAEAARVIRVIIADSEAIFRVGIRKVLAVEDDLRVVAQAETFAQTLSAVTKFPADVLLFESRISSNAPEAASEILKRAPELKIVAITGDMEPDQTVEYLRRGVRGIVTRSIGPDLLVRCVRKIADGETWLDNRGVNWVIEAYRSQATLLTTPRSKNRLTDKEMLIVSCVAQGMRNKEIAHEVGTTEQVIKNYLRKVYDKLGVSDRLELALYCIHHRMMESQNAAAELAQDMSTSAAAPGASAKVQ